LNHGIETNHQAVSADLGDIAPLNLHVRKRKKEEEQGDREYADEKSERNEKQKRTGEH
jgi:hypothetical protein